MENMTIYNAVRAVPDEAKKPIKGGRLKGKTDINPMWRIKALTEQFGPCGFGWKYEIVRRETLPSPTGEIAAFVDINLYIKVDGEWSDPIPGTGGNSFVEKESNGPHMSDECFKMALTDALSVACKAIGVAADVYWETDRSKYDKPDPPAQDDKKKSGKQPAPQQPEPPPPEPPTPPPSKPPKSARQTEVTGLMKKAGMKSGEVISFMRDNFDNKDKVDSLTEPEYESLCAWLIQC